VLHRVNIVEAHRFDAHVRPTRHHLLDDEDPGDREAMRVIKKVEQINGVEQEQYGK